MLCLAAWCGTAYKKNASQVGTCIDVRTELSNKHVGYLYWKSDSNSGLQDLFELQRQCGALFRTDQTNNTIPCIFLRVRFEGYVISLKDRYQTCIAKEASRELAKLLASQRPVVHVCWEQDAYVQVCTTMSRVFERFEYVTSNTHSVLECVFLNDRQVAQIPAGVLKIFGAHTLILHMKDKIVSDKMFCKPHLRLKVLKLRGGRYHDGWDYYLCCLNSLEELDVDEPKQTSEIMGSLNLKRLRLSNCKLSDVPFTVSCMVSLVALDLSNNNLQSLPTWIYRLYNLESLVLRNNPRLSGVLDVRNFPNLVTLDVSSCNLKVQR